MRHPGVLTPQLRGKRQDEAAVPNHGVPDSSLTFTYREPACPDPPTSDECFGQMSADNMLKIGTSSGSGVLCA